MMVMMAVATTIESTKIAVIANAAIDATVNRCRINLNTAIGRITATVVAATMTDSVAAVIRLAKASTVGTTETVVAVAVVHGNSEP